MSSFDEFDVFEDVFLFVCVMVVWFMLYLDEFNLV